MSFSLGMSIIDDVIQNIRTSLAEKWLRNSQTVRLLLKKIDRARAAGCINIYYNWTDILLSYDACSRIAKHHRKVLRFIGGRRIFFSNFRRPAGKTNW